MSVLELSHSTEKSSSLTREQGTVEEKSICGFIIMTMIA